LDIFEDYSVDLSTAFSASSLAIIIFRTLFLTINIPLLSYFLETNIRRGYKGGAVQVFKSEGSDLRLYDVNSLYPRSMTLPMPLHYLDRLSRAAKDINLDTFAGFIYATVYAPKDIVPLSPTHEPGGDRLTFPPRANFKIDFMQRS
jgi:hypothetical protein